MTTTQLAQRLASNLTTTDLATMPAAAVLDIVNAINAGVQEVFALLPGHYKRATLTKTLRAPESISLTFPSRYSTTVDGTPFASVPVGCTIRIGAQDNEIAGASAVVDEYLGQDLTASATIYRDVIPLAQEVERINSGIRLYASDGGLLVTLERDEAVRNLRGNRRIGRPAKYCIEALGVDLASVIRVHPMPEVDYQVRFEAEVTAPKIQFQNIVASPAELPVPSRIEETVLTPVCRRHLLDSIYWKAPSEVRGVLNAADRALDLMTLAMPPDMGPGGNAIETPPGF